MLAPRLKDGVLSVTLGNPAGHGTVFAAACLGMGVSSIAVQILVMQVPSWLLPHIGDV